jgi:hypothetical protein
MLYSATPFFMAYLARLGERRLLAATAILLAVLAVNLRTYLPVLQRPEVVHPSPAVLYLIDRGYTRIWADFWVAYAVDFDSDERIIAATVAVTPDKDVWIADNRYRPYLDTLLASADPPFAFIDGSERDMRFQSVLAKDGIQYNRVVVGGIAVYDHLRPPVPFTP